MDLDQLLLDADPARLDSLTDEDVWQARRAFDAAMAHRELCARPSRRLTAVAAGVAVAVAAGVIAVVLPDPPGQPTSVAGAVLDAAASAAASGPSIVVGPDQYLYVDTRSSSASSTQASRTSAYAVGFTSTTQLWEKPDGSGEEITTYNSPPRLVGSSSKAAWIAAGRPSLARFESANRANGQLVSRLAAPSAMLHTSPNGTKLPKGETRPPKGFDPGVAPDNLAELPTDPNGLRRDIAERRTGLADISVDVEDPSTPGGTFFAAAQLLDTPSVDVSAALRSALFKVMAAVPGSRLLGVRKDHVDRSGTAIESPIYKNGQAEIVIVNAKTGQLLESEAIVADPSRYPVAFRADLAGDVLGWADVIRTGVVDSIGSLPR